MTNEQLAQAKVIAAALLALHAAGTALTEQILAWCREMENTPLRQWRVKWRQQAITTAFAENVPMTGLPMVEIAKRAGMSTNNCTVILSTMVKAGQLFGHGKRGAAHRFFLTQHALELGALALQAERSERTRAVEQQRAERVATRKRDMQERRDFLAARQVEREQRKVEKAAAELRRCEEHLQRLHERKPAVTAAPKPVPKPVPKPPKPSHSHAIPTKPTINTVIKPKPLARPPGWGKNDSVFVPQHVQKQVIPFQEDTRFKPENTGEAGFAAEWKRLRSGGESS